MTPEGSPWSFLHAILRATADPHGRMSVVEAVYEVGAMALPVVALVAAFVGTNVTLVGSAVFAQFGQTSQVGIFVALAGVREMVPVAACFMLAAKSGSAMAALVATMRLGGQLTALEAMAVDPVRYLALPRLVATVIAAPLLVILGDAICLLTGAAVAVAQLGVEAALYWEGVTRYVGIYDLYAGLVKGLVFGVLIGTASLYHGFTAPASPAGVGRASNYAAVSSAILCIVVNYALTEILY